MDFFARQDAARRASRRLLVLFVLAMLGMALVVHLSVGALSMLLGGSDSLAEPSAPALALIGLIWLTVLSGAFFRTLDVRAGGEALARRFGASPIPEGDRDERLRRLRHTVAEMAIAAAVPEPAIRVLTHERSINAFVLGSASRPVIVVSRGAIDALGAEELRGVIAHEIAHVAQGDLALNMRLLVALGGLDALDEVGRTLIGPPGEWRHGQPPAHPAALVGWLLRALGGLGVLAGASIRAAVSRGREYLADATAAQLTRDPSALASALAGIRDARSTPARSGLHAVHAEELAHLCFHGGLDRGGWLRAAWRRAFASHPPLQSRIDALDPHVDIKRRQRARREAERAVASAAAAAPPGLSGSGDGTVVVSDRIQLLLSDGIDSLAALCALFADRGSRGEGYRERLSRGFDARLATRVTALQGVLRSELENDRLAVIERACTVLCEIATGERRRRFLLELERVLAAGGELDLGDYATLRLLRRRLGVEFPVLGAAAGEPARRFASMGEQFALLLSLLVESSGAPSPALEHEFRRVLRCYTDAELPRRTRGEPGIVVDLERAFQTLAVQPLATRRAFVQHCTEIVEADGRVVPAERGLLVLIAAALEDEPLAA